MVVQVRSIGLSTAHMNDAATLFNVVLPIYSRFVDETVLDT